MLELTSIDIFYLIFELKKIKGYRITKIYPINDGISIKLFKLGNSLFLNITTKLVWISDKKPETFKMTNLCKLMRSKLERYFIEYIEQVDYERLIKIKFLFKNDVYYLYVELIRNGNIVLVKDNNIVYPLYIKKFKFREIKPKQEYKFPLMENILNFNFNKFVDFVKGSKNLAKDIAKKGVGGKYAEEVISVVGKKEKYNDDEIKEIYNSLKGLLNKKIEPVFYIKSNIFSPFLLNSVKEEPMHFKSFSELIDFISKKDVVKKSVFDKDIEKLERIIKMQKQRLDKINREIEINKEKGEKIYENYNLIKELIDNVNELRKKNKNIKEILKKKGIVFNNNKLVVNLK